MNGYFEEYKDNPNAYNKKDREFLFIHGAFPL
jgi:hypothetical protein